MVMIPYQLCCLPYQDSLKALEDDIQHANALAAAIPRAKGGTLLQMKLVYNHLAPLFLLFLQWMDCSCAGFLHRYTMMVDQTSLPMEGRPPLGIFMRLHGSLEKLEVAEEGSSYGKKVIEEGVKLTTNIDLQREDKCGICLEPCTKWFYLVVATLCVLNATESGTKSQSLAHFAREA